MSVEQFASPPQNIAEAYDRRVARIWHTVRERHGGDLLSVIDGRDNRPILVVGSHQNPEYIIKIDQRQIGHNILLLEGEAVQAAANLPNRPSWLTLPHYIDGEDDHLVLGWVPGRRFTAAEIAQNFTPAEQERFGQDLAQIITWNSQLGLSALWRVIQRRRNDVLVMDDDIYPLQIERHFPSLYRFERFERWIREFTNYSAVEKLNASGQTHFARVADELVRMELSSPTDFDPPKFWGHNDLHEDNIVFERRNGQWCIAGLIDWGSTAPSSIEREPRFVIGRMGAVATRAVSDALSRPAGPSILPKIELWASVEALTAITMAGPIPDAVQVIRHLYPNTEQGSRQHTPT